MPYFENDAEFQIVQVKKKRANIAKKPEFTFKPLLSQGRKRLYSPNKIEKQTQSWLLAKALKVLRSTNINVKSQTWSKKFSIYSKDIKISSQNTKHGWTNNTSQIVYSIKMKSTNNLSHQSQNNSIRSKYYSKM